MDTIAHWLDHLPREFARLLLSAWHGLAAAWGRLMERNAARAPTGAGDDIAWVSGEPDEAAEG